MVIAMSTQQQMSREERIERLKIDFTETEKVILSRRSVRLYKKEQVPEFMVKRVLEAGRFAPSAANCQPWKFIVVRDKDLIYEMTEDVIDACGILRKIVDYTKPGKEWLRPIVKFMTRLRKHDLHPIPFGAISLIADRKLGLWHGAPTVILIFYDTRGAGSPVLDCGITGQNMVISAHSMGLGTCWVSFAKPLFEYTPKWKKIFGISYPFKFITSLAVGWPMGEPDGMVARQTHAVDWYEDAKKSTIY
jgi:nitroreductase